MWLLNVGSFHLGLQIRTHSIRKAHENIDKTLKAAEVILSHFDQYRQVGFLVIMVLLARMPILCCMNSTPHDLFLTK